MILKQRLSEKKREKTRKAKRSRSDMEEDQERQRSNMYVSFSKRRKGLFEKATDLCVKCGAQIAIVVLDILQLMIFYDIIWVKRQPNLISFSMMNINAKRKELNGFKFCLKQKNEFENNVALGVKKWIEKV